MIAWLLRLAGYRLEKIVKQPARSISCGAKQYSDQMVCQECDLAWDVNDAYPPACDPAALKSRKSRTITVYGRPTVIPPRPSVVPPRPPPKADCTAADRWNCKYCKRAKSCEAISDL